LAHHSTSLLEWSVRKMSDADFAFVDNPRCLHNQLRQRLLTWSGHVTSWVDEPDLGVLVVRFEDLKMDPVLVFNRVIRFCGLEEDPPRIEKAVRFSQFEQVKQQEDEHGFTEKMPTAKSFFRKGQVNSWREEMTPELAKTLIANHAVVMRRFGYLDENGELIY
jgi:aryl sulfotransferase